MTEIQTRLLARMCHRQLATMERLLGEPVRGEWAEANDEERKLLYALVEAASEEKASPEYLHKVWSREREANGWKLGDNAHREKKCTQWLIPFEDLPMQEIQKYQAILGIVAAALDVAADAQGIPVEVKD